MLIWEWLDSHLVCPPNPWWYIIVQWSKGIKKVTSATNRLTSPDGFRPFFLEYVTYLVPVHLPPKATCKKMSTHEITSKNRFIGSPRSFSREEKKIVKKMTHTKETCCKNCGSIFFLITKYAYNHSTAGSSYVKYIKYARRLWYKQCARFSTCDFSWGFCQSSKMTLTLLLTLI